MERSMQVLPSSRLKLIGVLGAIGTVITLMIGTLVLEPQYSDEDFFRDMKERMETHG
jgi:hypothetical protein